MTETITKPLTLADISPGPCEHAILIGTTGCGKTSLAKRFLPRTGGLIIINPKRTFKLPWQEDILVIEDPKQIKRRMPERFMYSPKHEFLFDWQSYDLLYGLAYQRGKDNGKQNVCVYTDEIFCVRPPVNKTCYLLTCYVQGRELGIQLISGNQRPSAIPRVLISEATHRYFFNLNEDDDFARIKRMMKTYHALPRYEFMYSNSYEAPTDQTFRLNI